MLTDESVIWKEKNMMLLDKNSIIEIYYQKVIGNFFKTPRVKFFFLHILLSVNRLLQISSIDRFENMVFSNTHLLPVR